MNPDLSRLQPYPFERMAKLFAGVTPPADLETIRLSIGEPGHPTPAFIAEAIIEHLHGLSQYPSTRGSEALRRAICEWLTTRFALPPNSLDPDRHALPVNGTREALFAIAQCVIDRNHNAAVLMPNPFYQIYEGAALLAGAQPVFVNATRDSDYLADFDAVDEATWQRCLVFHSLSKRSNAPGLRAGFVASDADLIQAFFRYRTYHGCAMPPATQDACIRAWRDEAHMTENRRLYREKFSAVADILSPVMEIKIPPASFYLWQRTPMEDSGFSRELYRQQNVVVLPGSYLSRDTATGNPGHRHVRMALVAPLDECIDAAQRIRTFIKLL